MSSINKVIVLGNLGKDPEVRYSSAGDACANFSVATSEKWTDKNGEKKESTQWHNIVAWKKLAENCAQYLHKGSKVYVEGKLQTRKYTDKNGVDRWATEIIARDVVFLSTKNNQQQQEEQAPSSFEDGGELPF